MDIRNFKEKIELAKKYAADEIEFKDEIFLVALLKEVFGKDSLKKDSAVTQASTISKEANVKQLSIREFLNEKKPTNDVERVLAIGYFLEKYESLNNFNFDDIKNAFIKSKETLPQNIHDKINMNIRKGHIAELPEKKDEKKSYYLTATGEKFVEQGFKSEA